MEEWNVGLSFFYSRQDAQLFFIAQLFSRYLYSCGSYWVVICLNASLYMNYHEHLQCSQVSRMRHVIHYMLYSVYNYQES